MTNALTFSFNIRSIQQLSITSEELSYTHRCNLHIIAIALLALVGRVTGIKSLMEYSEKIVNARMEDASHLLPPLLDSMQNYEKHNLNVPHLMVDKVRIVCHLASKTIILSTSESSEPQMALAESLQNAGMENSRLQSGVPYSLNPLDQSIPRHSWVDPGSVQAAAMSHLRSSAGDIHSIHDNDSVNSSPDIQRRTLVSDYNFDAMKRVLAEPSDATKRERVETQRKLINTFRNANFDDLLRRTEPKHDVIQTRLSDLFNSLAAERQILGQSEQLKAIQPNKSVYENNFPELFFY